MAFRELPSPELLRQLLDYNPETGEFHWRARLPCHFNSGKHSAEHNCAAWNGKHAGRRADTPRHMHGYHCVSVLNYPYLAHRVAWAVHYGEWPKKEIDHINGVRGDNRIANLRDVSRQTNTRNTARTKSNSSGRTGVRKTRGGRWKAEICGRHLGVFDSFEDAKTCREAAERELGFSAIHGTMAGK